MSHPSYDPHRRIEKSGMWKYYRYTCDCGHHSVDIKSFREHVKKKHNFKYALKVCSVADVKKMYPKLARKKYPKWFKKR